MRNSVSILRTSNVYFAMAFVVLASALAYGILQARVLTNEKRASEDNGRRAQEKAAAYAAEEESFKTYSEEHSKRQEEASRKLVAILPPDENYTDLTRAIDDYFAAHDSTSNPMFLSSLRYGKGASAAVSPNLSVLPVTMNIEGTRDNFFKFLDYVRDSGSLASPSRLMEINSIQLNFPEGGEVITNPQQKINFTLDMNGYYLQPKVQR